MRNVCILALLAALGVLISGYHPGAEDDEVYLAAIKRDLNPALFPHDADFFALQLQATVFDKLVAVSTRTTHVPLGWGIFIWHYGVIFLVLLGCWRLSRRLFSEEYAHWASTALITVLLTLPVAGTGLYIVDQNLHPRALATAAILAATVAVLDRRFLRAGILLAVAMLFHPIMGSFGVSWCVFLGWRQTTPGTGLSVLALAPLGWIFKPASDAWRVAADTRNYYFLGRWEWYEWLGVFAPLAILWWFRRIGQRQDGSRLAHVATRLVFFGAFQFVVAVAMMLPDGLQRLRPLQPMRYLHLLYVIFIVLAGGVLGQKFLRAHRWRWLLLFVPLAIGMFMAQRATYPASAHLEWPGAASSNAWMQAFAWIREHTPPDSYFAIGADYMRRPGEDYHGFRGLAERSRLADATKDAAVATQVPPLAARWQAEVEAQRGWEHFGPADFAALKARFGVDWVLLERPAGDGMDCPYENQAVRVCRVK